MQLLEERILKVPSVSGKAVHQPSAVLRISLLLPVYGYLHQVFFP